MGLSVLELGLGMHAIDRRTNRRTDGQTDTGHHFIMPLLLRSGHIMLSCSLKRGGYILADVLKYSSVHDARYVRTRATIPWHAAGMLFQLFEGHVETSLEQAVRLH